MEKFYSVAVEYSDGTKKAVAARGESHGWVFQQVKQMPGIRRVGKVSEVSPDVYEAVKHGRTMRPEPEPRRPVESGTASLNQPLRGPTVVIDARPVGGEQPFKHLQAPPERPKPPMLRVQSPAPAGPRPEPAVPAAPEARRPVSVLPHSALDAAPSLEYRIVRSRRADGPPYLLQRGTWVQRDGKRNFKLDWEKGFDLRAKAEQHLKWVQESAQELAAVEEDSVEDSSHAMTELAQV